MSLIQFELCSDLRKGRSMKRPLFGKAVHRIWDSQKVVSIRSRMPERITLSVNQSSGSAPLSWVVRSPILGLFASIGLRLSALLLPLGLALPSHAAEILFKSSFEGSLLLSKPYECQTSCWQDIRGSDALTGDSWAPQAWLGDGKLQLLADTPVTPDKVNNYVLNEIQRVMGPHGQQTSVLYSEIRKRGSSATQTPYLLTPSTTALQGDLYVSYWIKLQPDLLKKLGPNNWWVLFEWKTNAQQRLITYILVDRQTRPYWHLKADDLSAGPARSYWEISNRTAPVPVGEWFKFEFFWHRSSQHDGRAWQAINGQVVFDRFGSLLGGNDPIDRIMLTQVYAGGSLPLYQWVDDIEIWDGFPCGDGTPCGPKLTGPQ